LAKELGMTVNRLCNELSAEEMTGWAAYFELKNERDEKQMEEAKSGSSRVMR